MMEDNMIKMKNNSSWNGDSEARAAASSSRILYDVPCAVCRDHSSGKHYGIFACDGCAGFFKRSVRRARQYSCKSRRGECLVDKAHRNQCRACRLAKCLEVGMNKDAVQHERGPRNSTLRRQMALFLKEDSVSSEPPSSSHLPITIPTNRTILEEAACESAARLLFLNVRWARQIGAFSALPLSDRTLLLEESWGELFVLGAVNLIPTLSAWEGARAFCSIVEGVARLQLDVHEVACLRAIVLFQPGVRSPSSFEDPRAIAALHDHSHMVLNKYLGLTHPTKPLRFSSLLMLLPTLKLVSSTAIEELFFRKTIGHIPIERIISDMYKSGDGEL